MSEIFKRLNIIIILPLFVAFYILLFNNYNFEFNHSTIYTLLLIFIFIVLLDLRKKRKNIEYLNSALKEKREQAQYLKKENKVLNELAIKDYLTQVGNRRYFFDFAKKAFLLAKREKKSLSLIVVDIDNFKMVNDQFGHQIGDEILKSFATCMERELRKSDILGRVGGEEFAVLLPNTNLDEAIQIAEKIRIRIKNSVYKSNEKNISVSGSFGVSQINLKYDQTLDNIYARADVALYKAKSIGKNRVCYA